MRRIGLLSGPSAEDRDAQVRRAVFKQRLQELGWTDGRNVRIDYWFGGGDADLMRRQAAEIVALAPDVIVSTGGAATERMLQVTRTVPIVFTLVPDPVGAGLVPRLSRPGGNATGFMQFEYGLSGKWVELLKQIAPSVTRAAVLRDPAITAGIGQLAIIQSVAPSVGVEVSPININDLNEVERAVSDFARAKWRPNFDGERVVGASSRSDNRACGPTQTPRSLF
jgi:putative ABC transport system substrate-binding protein